jgi:hypothetical protein
MCCKVAVVTDCFLSCGLQWDTHQVFLNLPSSSNPHVVDPDDIEFAADDLLRQAELQGSQDSAGGWMRFIATLAPTKQAFGKALEKLSHSDRRQVIAAVSALVDADADVILDRSGAADLMRNKARDALAGTDGAVWDDREDAAWAFNLAAAMLALY